MVQTKRFSNTVLLSVVRRNIISFILTSVTVLSDVSSVIFHSCLVRMYFLVRGSVVFTSFVFAVSTWYTPSGRGRRPWGGRSV